MPRTRVYTCVSCMSHTCASLVCLNVRHVCPPHVYLLCACHSPCLTLACIHVYVCMSRYVYLLYACTSRMPHFRVYIMSHTCASLVCVYVRHMCPPRVSTLCVSCTLSHTRAYTCVSLPLIRCSTLQCVSACCRVLPSVCRWHENSRPYAHISYTYICDRYTVFHRIRALVS